MTVFGCEAPHNVNNQASRNAFDLCYTIADTMATLGKNMFYAQGEVMVVMCPSHAETIAADGWSKLHVKEYLYEKARKPLSAVDTGRALRARGGAQLLAPLGEPYRRERDGSSSSSSPTR